MSFAAWRRATPGRRRLALECAWSLTIARVLTLMPARLYSRRPAMVGRGRAADVAPIARMLTRVSAGMPFRCRCLEEAIALRRMLARRGIDAAVCLGVSLDRADRADPSQGRAAHAWVEVGGLIVAGAEERERYAEVARI